MGVFSYKLTFKATVLVVLRSGRLDFERTCAILTPVKLAGQEEHFGTYISALPLTAILTWVDLFENIQVFMHLFVRSPLVVKKML